MNGGFRTHDSDFDEALERLREHDYASALTLLAPLVAFNSSDEDVFNAWLDAHFGDGRFRRVVQLADEGIAAGHHPASLLVWKALALAELKDFVAAESAARAALNAEDECEEGLVTLANILVLGGKPAEALDVCRDFVAKYPDSEIAARHLIELATHIGETRLVVDSAQAYVKRFEPDAEVLHMLGLAHLDLGDLENAERALRQAVKVDPEAVELHTGLLLVYLAAKQDGKVRRHLERLERRDPELAAAVSEELDAVFDEGSEGDDAP